MRPTTFWGRALLCLPLLFISGCSLFEKADYGGLDVATEHDLPEIRYYMLSDI